MPSKWSFRSRCPQRNLIISISNDGIEDDQDNTAQEVTPYDDPNECDNDQDDTLHESNDAIQVMRCIMTTLDEYDKWKHTNPFHTFLKCRGKSAKSSLMVVIH